MTAQRAQSALQAANEKLGFICGLLTRVDFNLVQVWLAGRLQVARGCWVGAKHEGD